MSAPVDTPTPSSGKTCASRDSRDLVSPDDILIVERVLAQIDNRNSVLECLVYWKFAFTIFKGIEIAYTCLEDRSEWEQRHRSLLTRLLGVTEWLHSAAAKLNESDLNEVSLTRDAISANLKYLRRKYSQWYVPVDEEFLKKTAAAIQNERATT